MPFPADLLKPILAAPNDDHPRKNLIEWCRDNNHISRADLIEKQLTLVQMPNQHYGNGSVLASRIERLIETHQQEWLQFDELDLPIDKFRYERGFVEMITLCAEDFLQHSKTLFTKAPIRHLDLTHVAPVAEQLFASPYLSNIVTLSLNRCQLTDDHMQLLAQSPHLKNLRWLSIMFNQVDIAGVEALVRSEYLNELEFVNFYGNIVDATEYQAVDQGVIVEHILPEIGAKLEEQYGEIPWLHSDATLEKDLIPDRFMMAY